MSSEKRGTLLLSQSYSEPGTCHETCASSAACWPHWRFAVTRKAARLRKQEPYLQGLGQASVGLIAQGGAHVEPLQPQQLSRLSLPLKLVEACTRHCAICRCFGKFEPLPL